MASAQQLRQRIQAVKNIKKITTAMKMVATAKLRVAQEKLTVARFFASSVFQTWKTPAKPAVKSQLWIAMASDRGLCGAINSSIARAIRDNILAEAKNPELQERGIVLYGEKGRGQLNSQFSHMFRGAYSDCDSKSTFNQCGELADYWLALNANKSLVYFQRFKSLISYETTIDTIYSFDVIKDTMQLDYAEFEMEGPSDVLRNFYEFMTAVKLLQYLAETNASTLSARMQAMSNSSTNATDMIDTLTLFLNRSRQAKITTELSEIVGGAAAVDEEGGSAETEYIVEEACKTKEELEASNRELEEERKRMFQGSA
jgi:F-type H+-transporting ATPase subunit gamma